MLNVNIFVTDLNFRCNSINLIESYKISMSYLCLYEYLNIFINRKILNFVRKTQTKSYFIPFKEYDPEILHGPKNNSYVNKNLFFYNRKRYCVNSERFF